MFELVPGQLTLRDIYQLLNSNTALVLTTSAYEKIVQSQAIVQYHLQQEHALYGINTGFGLLAHKKISASNRKKLQLHLIRSHAAGVGEPLDDEIVKLSLLLKINSLAIGASGVSFALIERLIAFYNLGIYPIIPQQGSVGASGDLAPLAHLALALIGEGEVRWRGQRLAAQAALQAAQLQPLVLIEKEGLALLNGTQISTAIALMGLLQTQRNFAIASIAGALSLDAANGHIAAFHPFIAHCKNNHGQRLFSAFMRRILQGSEIGNHPNKRRVQDPYSLRCQPQVMGAIWTYLHDAQTHLMAEANAVSDNPLISVELQQMICGGNFHAELTAFSADIIAMVGAEIGAIAERRIALLIDPHLNAGLPPFLVPHSGLNSGFMLAQVTAAALASENKTLAHPASVDSIPTSSNQEDHVSMATFAAIKTLKIAKNVLYILAIETLAACQGIDLRAPLKTSPLLLHYYAQIRAQVPYYDKDRYFAPDIEKIYHILMQIPYYDEAYRQLFYIE